MLRVYWANALFSDADRRFNEVCADALRAAGYEVVLPQAVPANAESAPTAESIFKQDTTELLSCDVLIACLDQETIDAGVACEVGLAYAAGVPILGLLTDLRQFRLGEGRVYKNPFVVGAIERLGGVCSSVSEVVRALGNFTSGPEDPAAHFDRVAEGYDGFVEKLESWYKPRWTTPECIQEALCGSDSRRVLEIGCGTGRTAAHIAKLSPRAQVLGFDASEGMVVVARNRSPGLRRLQFTSSKDAVVEAARVDAFDTVVAAFVLHDIRDRKRWFAWVSSLLTVGGQLLILDLSTLDLPRVSKLVQRELAAPTSAPDPRLNPSLLAPEAEAEGLETLACLVHMPSVTFSLPEDLELYLRMFGVCAGFDFPLAPARIRRKMAHSVITQACLHLPYPLVDRRAFVQWQLAKRQ